MENDFDSLISKIDPFGKESEIIKIFKEIYKMNNLTENQKEKFNETFSDFINKKYLTSSLDYKIGKNISFKEYLRKLDFLSSSFWIDVLPFIIDKQNKSKYDNREMKRIFAFFSFWSEKENEKFDDAIYSILIIKQIALKKEVKISVESFHDKKYLDKIAQLFSFNIDFSEEFKNLIISIYTIEKGIPESIAFVLTKWRFMLLEKLKQNSEQLSRIKFEKERELLNEQKKQLSGYLEFCGPATMFYDKKIRNSSIENYFDTLNFVVQNSVDRKFKDYFDKNVVLKKFANVLDKSGNGAFLENKPYFNIEFIEYNKKDNDKSDDDIDSDDFDDI